LPSYQEKCIGRIERFFDVVIGAMSRLLQIDKRLSYETELFADRPL